MTFVLSVYLETPCTAAVIQPIYFALEASFCLRQYEYVVHIIITSRESGVYRWGVIASHGIRDVVYEDIE